MAQKKRKKKVHKNAKRMSPREFRALLDEISEQRAKGRRSKEQVKKKPLYSFKNVKPWPKDFPNVTVHTTLSKLTSHPDYEAAKTGNREAALRVALDLVNIEKAKKLGNDHPNAVLLPVSQMEEAGRNVLPRALAWVISKHSGLLVATNIIETRKVSRTKKSALVKFFDLPVFEGKVIQGQDYILIDDAVSQGATLSELRHFIDNVGGNVVNISTFAAAQFSAKIAPRTETIQKIEEKFGRDGTEKFLREYSVAGTLEALTGRQALYLLSFGSLDTLRERATSEGIPRGRRILQEGTRD